jgi:microcystin-dependent protein
MAEPFLSEIRIMSFNFAPKGWALCNGQLLPINQNQALFSLLGTVYGGDGRVNFALPDLRSRVPFHEGNGHTLGERAGQEAHTLTQSEMPTHVHSIVPGNNAAVGTTANANMKSPVSAFWANFGKASYSTSAPNVAMSPATVSSIGGSQPHENRSPYLVLNFCIALQGIFPSQT